MQTTTGTFWNSCSYVTEGVKHYLSGDNVTSIIIALIVGIVIITIAHLIFRGFVINTYTNFKLHSEYVDKPENNEPENDN